ncbi:hypothetical protein SK355_14540, partial [Candidatus Fukatsuia symbiotica]|uniref:hypothetical protein n=1 Tax=Candidatus Fukatsuia symbiotica TaxID=1878942 RepID=UPI002B2498C9
KQDQTKHMAEVCQIVCGVLIPPCGVPAEVKNSRHFSINPAFNHCTNILRSMHNRLSLINEMVRSSSENDT